jgi:chromate transporter
LLHRLPGGFVAGAFFVLPSVFILFALCLCYVAFGTVPRVAAIFGGLKAAFLTFGGAYAVLAYIAQAGVE